MNSTEKISNAKKRINELERLIRYWDNSKESRINSSNVKKIEIEVNDSNIAA